VSIERYAESEVPTEYGPVRVVVFRRDTEEHVALVVGAPTDGALVRVHSECWTGEVLRSKKCDCREQLDAALAAISAAGAGIVIYLRQEGRGIGLGNKIRAYALQEGGADTVDANRMLGFGDDERTYDVAADMLRALGVVRVRLLTNNPAKVDGLRAHGIDVVREALSILPNEHNADYLAVKAKKMGHL
jgi:GTP cyclohydrolase II/3,4-dihydroxy 2-butanone 4-phosphate synthase/GTP cyclohydrolase II